MKFHRWQLPRSALTGSVSPQAARDLIVECFYQAQCETFARARQKLTGSPHEPAAVRAAVIAAVRLAFKESGGDFEKPTRGTLNQIVEVLGRKALAWGTPPDIIQHHGSQIRSLLEHVEG